MSLVLKIVQFAVGAAEGPGGGKGAQQLVMAGSLLVRARQDRIDYAQARSRHRFADWRRPRRRGRAACSNARTTVVPMATTRPPWILVRSIARAVDAGMRYGSSKGSSASSAGSPVDEIPAACVMVAKRMPRAIIAASSFQSSTNPAEGGSNATGGPAIGVHTSHSASGSGTCGVLYGAAMARQPFADFIRRAVEPDGQQPRVLQHGLHRRAERPENQPVARTQSEAARGRSSVRVWKSPGPNTMAENRLTSSGASDRRPASRTSMPSPARLAGSVAASFATTRSPGRSRSGKAVRGRCRRLPRGVDRQQLGAGRTLRRHASG